MIHKPSQTKEAIEERLSKGVSLIRQGCTLVVSAKRAKCGHGALSKRLKEMGITIGRMKKD